MDEERLTRAASIFQSAVDLPTTDRAAYLSERCGDDTELRSLVVRLLARHDDSKDGQSGATPTRMRIEHEQAPMPTEHIGPYRILEKLGEGGFGDVHAAEQTEPVRRRVALKILKAGMDTREVLARFEAERQALAMMDHPNVCRVLDAGETPQGRPYFVMELLHGEPLTAYCDHHRLSMEERLRLFIPVCHAIQHAHQKGVIHRDVKPSNILVTLVDGKPVPKVIDFGIAKATAAHSLTAKTLYTVQGQIIGTPAYMSPEQAEMTGFDVDTRTDVYSLGVLLYELLTGRLPFETKTLKEAGLDAMRRIIREEEPPRPSTQVSTLGERAREEAARRQTDPARWRRKLKRELDWIVMKALEKERDRRYETVNGLAMDVGRYLADRPVRAGPPSAVYRAQKYLKRHRVGVGFAAVVFAAVAGGLIVVSVQKAEIAAARDEAMLVTESLEDMLSSVDPTKSGRDVTVRETLDQTAKTLGDKFEDQPLVEARLRDTVGEAYISLGEYDAAEPHFRRAMEIRTRVLGEENAETLEARNALARAYRYLGRHEESEALAEVTLDTARRVQGEEHPVTLASTHALAGSYLGQGRNGEAEVLYRQTLATRRRVLGEEHPETLGTMLNLAATYSRQGRHEEAVTLGRQTLEIQRRVLGEEHPQALVSMMNLAVAASSLDRHHEAEALYRETLEIQRRVLGEEHPSTLLTKSNLGWECKAQGRYEEAETIWREAVETCTIALGTDNPRTLETMHGLAKLDLERDRTGDGETMSQEMLETCRVALGEGHDRTLHYMGDLATSWSLQGRYEEADALHREALDTSLRVNGQDHPTTNNQRYNFARHEALQGRPEEAISFLRQALDHGYRDPGMLILQDTDLASLNGDPGFEAIVEELKRTNEEDATAAQIVGAE